MSAAAAAVVELKAEALELEALAAEEMAKLVITLEHLTAR
jgi:hypothetical protein